MVSKNYHDYLSEMTKLDDYSYLVYYLLLKTAPAIYGKKPAVLVNLRNGQRCLKDCFLKHLTAFEKIVKLNIYPLRIKTSGILLLIYNEELLKKSLSQRDAQALLKNIGYKNTDNLMSTLYELASRFCRHNSCPSEVGIFLGYPPEDVESFICKDRDCIFNGYWKCYHNPDRARAICISYDQAKAQVIERFLPNMGELKHS